MLSSEMATQQLEIDEQLIRRCYDFLSEEDRQNLHKLAIEKAKSANSVGERKEALVHLVQMFVLSYGQVSLPMLTLILDSIRALGEGGNKLESNVSTLVDLLKERTRRISDMSEQALRSIQKVEEFEENKRNEVMIQLAGLGLKILGKFH